jgi:hypothetical protein
MESGHRDGNGYGVCFLEENATKSRSSAGVSIICCLHNLQGLTESQKIYLLKNSIEDGDKCCEICTHTRGL